MPLEGQPKFESHLGGIRRCPHCGIARPTMMKVYSNNQGDLWRRADGGASYYWAAYRCTTCGGHILAKSSSAGSISSGHLSDSGLVIGEIFPDLPGASSELPDRARNYLNQAYETLSSPDAAAMVAGSAVDAMLKEKGYTEGSVYSRIDQAKDDNVLTENMAQWAHKVRLGSNRPRHADNDDPHVSPDEAKQAVDFAAALGEFLFVLTSRVERGIRRAESPSPDSEN